MNSKIQEINQIPNKWDNRSTIILLINIIIIAVLAFIFKDIHIAVGIFAGIIIAGLLFLIDNFFRVLDGISATFRLLENHNTMLEDNIISLKNIMKSLGSKMDVDLIGKLPETPREKFMSFLKKWSLKHKDNFNAMFDGEFRFSSDVFQILYLGLLKESAVEYYYSVAIVNNKDYFRNNKITSLRRNYVDIAKSKEIEILFIINDEQHEEHINQLEQEYKILENEIGGNSNITIKKGRVSWIKDRKKMDLVRDFGIAGDIACAEMMTEEGVEKYSLYFNINKHKKYLERFKQLKEIIEQENFQIKTN